MKLKHFITYSMVYILIFHIQACTYDYFQDETNYVIYVPEVADKTVTDCRIFIYDESTGRLSGERSAFWPFEGAPDIAEGLFRFRLPCGSYQVFCYTNTTQVEFTAMSTLAEARFRLELLSETSYPLREPSSVYHDIFRREILAGEYQPVDTTQIIPYIGKIVTRFKNTGADVSHIKAMVTRVKGVGGQQYLKEYNLPAHQYEDEYEAALDDTPEENGVWYEFEHNYFPTVEKDIMKINFTFYDEDNQEISSVQTFEIRDKLTQEALKLNSGERIIIELENNMVVGISVEGWSGIIDSPGGELSF